MNKAGQGYRKLLVFQAAHELVMITYKITSGFPKSEQFGLTSQMRRAAVSVAANIVEGHALDTTTLFLRHLWISFGSCKELEYYFELASELKYISQSVLDKTQQLEGRTAYLLSALIKSLKAKQTRNTRQELSTSVSLDSSDSFDSCN